VSDQHQRFQDRVRGSSPAVFFVAKWRHDKGDIVEIPPLRVAPRAADHEMYTDDGDFAVIIRQRWEAKKLGYKFTGRHDWPFEYMYVSSVTSVDRAFMAGGVEAYVMVSQDWRAIATIPGRTRAHWFQVAKRSKVTGNIERNYACPLDHVIFEMLEQDGR